VKLYHLPHFPIRRYCDFVTSPLPPLENNDTSLGAQKAGRNAVANREEGADPVPWDQGTGIPYIRTLPPSVITMQTAIKYICNRKETLDP
jgi:hypothetical protein